ncbi:DDE-type integrase/transposase/recombinase [Streptomyces sp. V1I1]|uniref:DDE-type integrase/transposase/recombinase n=1 Tax=Streptomyces sp. V1I1 TaxID=3042272 RepID=UPI00358F38AA
MRTACAPEAELDIEGVIRGRRRRTTIPEPSAPRPPDLVDRDFTASRPDQLWIADVTYVRTWSGWAYVAYVLDVYSRMIVGRQVANHMRTERPLVALEMALWRRRIKKDSGLIHGPTELPDKVHRPSPEGTFALPLMIRTQSQVKRAG